MVIGVPELIIVLVITLLLYAGYRVLGMNRRR